MSRYFALVPAAGSGSRLGGELPKQYRLLAGHPILWHALEILSRPLYIRRVFVVLGQEDAFWERFDWSPLGPKLNPLRCGGPTRARSVLNGLLAISEILRPDDWILVHDAARPCLSPDQLEELVRQIGDDAVGGLLAAPVADTLKRATGDCRVESTVPRENLWQAQTPQMFRYELLCKALQENPQVTDESQAVEALGFKPLLVAADASNLKVTWPADLQQAERILLERHKSP